MASSICNKKTKIPEVNQDYISSLPPDLIDEILKCLPLPTAAKMSVLSRKWRCNWLSLNNLVFDKAFWEEHQSSGNGNGNGNENINRERINSIISSILLNHIGPVHEFYLHVPNDRDQFLAAGYKKLTQPFNHMRLLYLAKLDFGDFNAFCFTIAMFQNCPFIKDLVLSVIPNKSVLQHKFDYDDSYKLGHLVVAKFIGITGSSPELKLIEYLLGNSVVLEKLMFKCVNLDPTSELKVSRELLQLPRASSKAKLVCLTQ